MSAETVTQTTVATVAGGLTGAQYIADKVTIPPPESILEFSIYIMNASGHHYNLSIRDAIFVLTACITIHAALRVKALKVLGKRRRCSDSEHEDDKEVK